MSSQGWTDAKRIERTFSQYHWFVPINDRNTPDGIRTGYNPNLETYAVIADAMDPVSFAFGDAYPSPGSVTYKHVDYLRKLGLRLEGLRGEIALIGVVDPSVDQVRDYTLFSPRTSKPTDFLVRHCSSKAYGNDDGLTVSLRIHAWQPEITDKPNPRESELILPIFNTEVNRKKPGKIKTKVINDPRSIVVVSGLDQLMAVGTSVHGDSFGEVLSQFKSRLESTAYPKK